MEIQLATGIVEMFKVEIFSFDLRKEERLLRKPKAISIEDRNLIFQLTLLGKFIATGDEDAKKVVV